MSFQSQKQVSGFTTQASYLVLALIICSMFSGIFYIVFNPFRLAFISNTLVGFLALNGILMIGFASVAVAFWHKLRIWPIEGLLFLSLVGSIVFSDYQKYSLTNIVIDLARPALFLVVVITIRSLVDLKTLSKSNLLHQVFVVNVYATVFSVVVCYVINAYVVPLYPAYSTIDSVLGMGWLVATQSPVIQALYGIVLIASGKRGVYIAVGLAILIAYRTKEVFWVLLCAVVHGRSPAAPCGVIEKAPA